MDDIKQLVRLSLGQIRRGLGEFFLQANFGGKRFVITSHGVDVGAIVGMEDLERLRWLDQDERQARELSKGGAPPARHLN